MAGFVKRCLGLASLAACLTACSSSTQPRLTDAELAEVLAVAVPAAIVANPDGLGKIDSIRYEIADSLGSAAGSSVTFSGHEPPLSAGVRAAISAAVTPGSAVFVHADVTQAMLLIAAPTFEGDSLIVTYEQRCGGDPHALCGSGGEFRMKEVSGDWVIVEVTSAWIS